MSKDYVGKIVDKILTPKDAGFNNPLTPWGSIRNIAGWQKPDAIQIHIAGFFLIDRRSSPYISIFKNACCVGKNGPPSGEEPIPFESLAEALRYKEKMHLSYNDSLKVKPVALAPDPGFGNAKPNVMWVDKKTAMRM